MLRYLNNKKGANIIMVIAFIVILGVIASGFIISNSYMSSSAARTRRYEQAKATAQSVNEAVALAIAGGSNGGVNSEAAAEALFTLFDESYAGQREPSEITLTGGGVIELYTDGSRRYTAPEYTIEGGLAGHRITNVFTLDPSKTILDIDTTAVYRGLTYAASIRLSADGYEYVPSDGVMGAYTIPPFQAESGEGIFMGDDNYEGDGAMYPADTPQGEPPVVPGSGGDGLSHRSDYALITLDKLALNQSMNVIGNIFSFSGVDINRTDRAGYAGAVVSRGDIRLRGGRLNRNLISMQSLALENGAQTSGKALASRLIVNGGAVINNIAFANTAELFNAFVNSDIHVEESVSVEESSIFGSVFCKEYNGVRDIKPEGSGLVEGQLQLFTGENPFSLAIPPQPADIETPELIADQKEGLVTTGGEDIIEIPDGVGGITEIPDDTGGAIEIPEDEATPDVPANVVFTNGEAKLRKALDELDALYGMTDMTDRANIPRWGTPNEFDAVWNARFPNYRVINQNIVCPVSDESPDYFIFVMGGTVTLDYGADIVIDETNLTNKGTGRVFIYLDANSRLEFRDAPALSQSGLIGASSPAYGSLKAYALAEAGDGLSSKYPANLHIVAAVNGSGKSLNNGVSIGNNRVILAQIYTPVDSVFIGDGSALLGSVICSSVEGGGFSLVHKAPHLPEEAARQNYNLPSYPVFGEFFDIPDINIPIGPKLYGGSRENAPARTPRAWNIVGRYR